MITSIQLQQFKSWRDTGQVRLAPLTALFGTNSSGKSSLLQWLLMLKQTAESPDRNQPLELGDDQSLVDMGTFPDLLFQHDTSQPLKWQLNWNLGRTLRIENPAAAKEILFEGDQLGFSASLNWQNNGQKGLGRTRVAYLHYQFAGQGFGMYTDNNKEKGYKLYADPLEGFKFARMKKGRAWELPAPYKCYGFPDQVRAYYQNAGFLSDFELEFERLFSRIHYLGPLREHPQRQYTWAGSNPRDMGPMGERVVDAILAARELGAYISPGFRKHKLTLEERIAKWLQQLGLVDSFSVLPVTEGSKLFQVWVKRSPQSPDVLITDVGFGVSQILPVIALCYYVPEGSILVLEQPEIHLHPSVQAGLADVFIDAIRTRGIQIILESHSEHLLRRLQRRMAEEAFSHEAAALYFCRIENGESKLDHLKLDTFGTIENWPQDFFGDEFGEIAATNLAAIRRKKAADQ
jgi:predicted ATPase